MRMLLALQDGASLEPEQVILKDVTVTFPTRNTEVGNAVVLRGILTLNGESAPIGNCVIRSSHIEIPKY